jgi:hypothetical protein
VHVGAVCVWVLCACECVCMWVLCVCECVCCVCVIVCACVCMWVLCVHVCVCMCACGCVYKPVFEDRCVCLYDDEGWWSGG